MTDLLVANGVPRHAIHPEDQSTTTYENLRNAKVVLQRLGIGKAVIVTDNYHMRRALIVARSVGIDAIPDTSGSAPAGLLRRLRRQRDEAVARITYRLRLPGWKSRDARDQSWARNIS